MHGPRMKQRTLWSRVLRSAALTLTAAGILFVTVSATAACGDPRGSKAGVALHLPFLTQLNGGPGQSSNSIVGLWHVTYMADGEFFFESFDMWHSDGTELENPNLPPVEGNVCVGVWKMIKPGIVQLNHIGWNFDANGNSTGTFTLTETNAVAPNGNKYQGVFDYKVYDVDGNLVLEVTGTQTATRITVN